MRTLFVVVLALFGLQHLVLLRAGEPYPALFAPRFSNAREVHDVATEYVRIPIAIDSAGRRLDLRTAGSRIERDPFGLITGNKLLAKVLQDEERARRDDLRRWLCGVLEEVGVRQPDSFELFWLQEKRDVHSRHLRDARLVDRKRIRLRCVP